MSSSRVELNDRLHALLQLPENKVCAECSDPQPSWATIVLPNSEDLLVGCLPLGLFCCLDCSAAHTRLGSNVCMVLSTNLGEWEEDDIVALEQGGNKKINEIFEAKNSLICSLKPRAGADNGQSREQFVFEKYGCRKYFDHTIYVQYSKSKETHVVNSIMERLETMRKNRGDFSSVEAKDGTQADKRIFKKPVNSDSNNDGPRIYQTHNVSPIMLENNTRNVRKQNRTSFSASKTVHEKGGLEKNVGVASGKIETCQMESNRVSSSIMSSSTKQNKTFGIGDNHPIQPQKRSSARDCSLTNSFTRRTRSQNNLASMKDSGTVDTSLDKQDSRRRNRSVSRSKRPSVQDTNMPDIGSSKGKNTEDPTRSRTRYSRPSNLEPDVRSRRSRRSQSRNSRNRSKSCNSRRKNNEGACEAVSSAENNICSHQTSMERETSRTATKSYRAKEKLSRDHHRSSTRRSSKKINLNDLKELMNSEAKKAEDLPEKRRSSSIKPDFLLHVDSKKMGAQGICSDPTGQFNQSLPHLAHNESGNFMAKSSNRKKLARSVATEMTFSDADFSDSFVQETKISKSLNIGSDFLLVMAASKKVKVKDLPKRRSLNIDAMRGKFGRDFSEDSEHYQSPSASDSNEHSSLDAQQHDENSSAGKRAISSDSKRSFKKSSNIVKSNSAATTRRSSKEFRRSQSMRIRPDFSVDCNPFNDLSGSVRQKIDKKKGATSGSQSDIIISTSQEKRGRSNHDVQSFEWSRSPVVAAKDMSMEASVVAATTIGKNTTNTMIGRHSMSRAMKFRTGNDSARAA